MARKLLTRDFLNERLVPELEAETVQYYDHLRRYLFAQQFVGGKTVLDIACGTGYGMRILGQGGASRVIGIDLSRAALRYIQQAQQSLPQHAQPRLVQANALALPLPAQAFDVIVSFETLEHLSQPRQFLAEARRILRPDGTLILSTPNRAVVSPNSATPFSPYHSFEPTLTELSTLIEEAGWKIVNLHGLTHSAQTAHLSAPARGPYQRVTAQHVAYTAYVRRAVRDLMPPLVYRWLAKWRKIPALTLADSVLTERADEQSSYFVVRCQKA